MKFRAIPKTIPIYTWKGYKGYMRQSVDNSMVVEILVTLCAALVIYPAYLWYGIVYTVKCTWDAVKFCTYSLDEAQEAMVQKVIKEREVNQ